jgi:hypothetical protein
MGGFKWSENNAILPRGRIPVMTAMRVCGQAMDNGKSEKWCDGGFYRKLER